MKLTCALLLLASIYATAQTNETMSADKHFASLQNAVSQYYSVSVDADGMKTINTRADYILKRDSEGHVGVGFICIFAPPETGPSTVDFQIISAGQWSFTQGLDYPISADGKAVTTKNQKITSNLNEVEHDPDPQSPLVDSMSAEVPLDQFKIMAWAKQVYFKTDDGFFEVPASERVKWKLLWNYFNLMNTNQQPLQITSKN